MRITANQLTVSRIVLMPIPVALILCNDRWIQLAAWALYVIIGVTDYFDGMLARKYGFTRFGRLTDPIADKIFVALMFLPLGLMGAVHPFVVVGILMRDPIITALRSMSERYGIPMKTATLAKYKTGIQMIAGGYIMFTVIVPEKAWALGAMSTLAALVWFFYVLKRLLRGKWDPRLLVMAGLMTFGALVRGVADVELTLLVYTMLILVVTWISAWNYLMDFARGVRGAARSVGASWWALHVVESIPVPLFGLAITYHPSVPSWLPMTAMSIELAVGALDNILTSENKGRTRRHVGIKLGVQLGLAAAFFVPLAAGASLPIGASTWYLAVAAGFGIACFVSAFIAFTRYAPRIL